LIKDSEPLDVYFESYDNESGIVALKWVFGKLRGANEYQETEITAGNFSMVTVYSIHFVTSIYNNEWVWFVV